MKIYVIVRHAGEYEEKTWNIISARLTPEEAQAECDRLSVRSKKRDEIKKIVMAEKLSWEASNPRPDVPVPPKPKMREGQSQKDHIKENLEPWRAELQRLGDVWHAAMSEWTELQQAHLLAWITERFGDALTEYSIALDSFLGYLTDYDYEPRYSYEETELVAPMR